MVGCDEGKAAASAPSGCGGRSDREAPPPAGMSGQVTEAARSSSSGRRRRLADVGRHSMSAGAAWAPRIAGARDRTSPAEAVHRSRDRAAWPSSRRRSDVNRSRPARDARGAALTNGTNREHPKAGATAKGQGAMRPAVTAAAPGRGVTSRRQREGQTTTRRRDARPVRSGGRRGRILGAGARPSQAAAMTGEALASTRDSAHA